MKLLRIISEVTLLSAMLFISGCGGTGGESAVLGSVFSSGQEAPPPATGPGVPAAPSGLSATVAAPNQISLSWKDNSINESGFKIERKAGLNGTYTEIATALPDAVSYADTGLAVSTTYYYRIRATNSVGDSSFTSEVHAATPAV